MLRVLRSSIGRPCLPAPEIAFVTVKAPLRTTATCLHGRRINCKSSISRGCDAHSATPGRLWKLRDGRIHAVLGQFQRSIMGSQPPTVFTPSSHRMFASSACVHSTSHRKSATCHRSFSKYESKSLFYKGFLAPKVLKSSKSCKFKNTSASRPELFQSLKTGTWTRFESFVQFTSNTHNPVPSQLHNNTSWKSVPRSH